MVFAESIGAFLRILKSRNVVRLTRQLDSLHLERGLLEFLSNSEAAKSSINYYSDDLETNARFDHTSMSPAELTVTVCYYWLLWVYTLWS
jgi:hypothetical protein